MYGVLKARAASVNVNYRYKAEELLYLLENSDVARDRVPCVVRAHGRRGARPAAGAAPPHPGGRRLGGAAPARRVDYEAWVSRGERRHARPALHPRRPLRALHRRHDGHAEGRPVAARGRLLQRARRARARASRASRPTSSSRPRRAWASAAGRSSACPSCTAPGSGASFNAFHRGGTIVLPEETRSLDADAVWRAVERHRCRRHHGDRRRRRAPAPGALPKGTYDVSSIRVLDQHRRRPVPRGARRAARGSPRRPHALREHRRVRDGPAGHDQRHRERSQRAARLPAARGHGAARADRSGVLPPGERRGRAGSPSPATCRSATWAIAEKTQRDVPGRARRALLGRRRPRPLAARRPRCSSSDASRCASTRGGEKVFVEEVERVLKSHPAVDDALVVGTPSERWGQQVTAVISLRPGADGARHREAARPLRPASRGLQAAEGGRRRARDRPQPERQARLRVGEAIRARRARPLGADPAGASAGSA